jgi:glycosyltransferase involved in cell wall biosynthesis
MMPIAPASNPSPASPLVSVIIPVYNGERIVLGAVRSALAQSHRNLEIFVVDDGSTDGTGAVLAAIGDARVRVLHQANAGTAAARNLALALARGQYIAFLDSDDRWFPDKIETELNVLRSAPEPIAVAYSAYYPVDDRGRLLNLAPVHDDAGHVLDVLLDGEDYLMPSVCLFDRRIFDALGSFNAGRYHEDHEFILRVSRTFPVYPTRRRLAVYRQSTSGKCRAILTDYARARTEELALLDDMADVLTPDQSARLRRNVLRSLFYRFLMYGFNAHAKRVLPEVDQADLRVGRKGRLGWLFAKTGINVMSPARATIQAGYRIGRQRWWNRVLAGSNVELLYG